MAAKKPAKRKPTRRKAKKPEASFDPTKPLKQQLREAFAQNIVNGGSIQPSSKGGFTVSEISATEAYMTAGYAATASAARRAASRLLTNGDIMSRIDHLRAEQARMLAERGCATKEECCMVLTELIRARHSDYLTMGEDGVNMFDIGPETLNGAALKKIKTRTQRDEHGNTIIEKQFDEIELESKIPAIKCLADLNGWNQADKTAEDHVNNEKKWLDAIMAQAEGRPRTPQSG